MSPKTLDDLIASDGANTLLMLFVASFLESKGLIHFDELMMFLERSAAEQQIEDVPELAAIVRELRKKLAVLGRIGTGGLAH